MKKYLILLFLFCIANVKAVSFVVNTTDDTIDANIGDGMCLDSQGECSLRAAIMQANILGTDEVIYLARGAVYELTLNNDIDTHADNDLDIFDSLTLSIANPELPINSLNEMPAIIAGTLINDRVFELHDGELVSFNGIFIAYGDAAQSPSNSRMGGGIYVSEQVAEFRLTNSIVALNQAGYGAGLYSKAEITWIESSDISYNILTSPGLPLFPVAGAAVFHAGSGLTLYKSSVHHNVLEGTGFFASALQLEGDGNEVSIRNTLVAENGVWPFGDSGIINGITAEQVSLYVNNSNITGNTGAGVRFITNSSHYISLRNSVLSNNANDNCGELTGVISFGSALNPAHIISSDGSCDLPEMASNIENVATNLSDLTGRFGGGSLLFFSSQYPIAGSVLIDAGNPMDVNSGNLSACEATDIHSVPRPLNGGLSDVCDVGIYESGDLIFLNGFELID